MFKTQTRKVRVSLITPMLGSRADKKVFTRFLQAQAEVDTQQEEEYFEDELSLIPEDSGGITIFPKDDKGVYVFDYQVKGFLKNAGNVLKDTLGVKNLRKKVEIFLFVKPRLIYVAPCIDGVLERPLRAMTPKGERSSIVASEYVKEGTTFEFALEMIKNKEIDWPIIESLLDYGKYCGLLQWRNGGYGRFKWEWIEKEID